METFKKKYVLGVEWSRWNRSPSGAAGIGRRVEAGSRGSPSGSRKLRVAEWSRWNRSPRVTQSVNGGFETDMVHGQTTRGRTSRGRRQPSNDEVVSRSTRNFSKGIPQPSTPFYGRILDCRSFPNDIRKQIGCLVKGNIHDCEISWAQWSDDNKTLIWNKFLNYYTFEDLDHARSTFEKYLTINYRKWMNKARADAKIEDGVECLDESCKNFPPRYLTKNQWEGMMMKFLASEFQDKSKKNSDNRKNNEEYVVYKGGFASFEANTRSLSLKLGRPASFSESYLAKHMPLNDRRKSIMSDYETYNSEELAKRRTQDEDDDEDEDDDDESTQGSTSYHHRKPIFLKDTHEAWMRATGGKNKGCILGMRPGDHVLNALPTE